MNRIERIKSKRPRVLRRIKRDARNRRLLPIRQARASLHKKPKGNRIDPQSAVINLWVKWDIRGEQVKPLREFVKGANRKQRRAFLAGRNIDLSTRVYNAISARY